MVTKWVNLIFLKSYNLFRRFLYTSYSHPIDLTQKIVSHKLESIQWTKKKLWDSSVQKLYRFSWGNNLYLCTIEVLFEKTPFAFFVCWYLPIYVVKVLSFLFARPWLVQISKTFLNINPFSFLRKGWSINDVMQIWRFSDYHIKLPVLLRLSNIMQQKC